MSEEKFDLKGDQTPQTSSTAGCIGIVILVGVIILACGTLIQIITIFEQGAWFIPGDPANFDPILHYPEVAAHAGDDVFLTEIRARFVRRDGTLELTADYEPAPDVAYEFYRLTGSGESNAPAGVIDPNAVAHQDVYVRIMQPFNLPFIGRDTGSWAFRPMPGMNRYVYSEQTSSVDESVPAPECHFSDLWTMAIEEEEANQEAVAQIRYDSDGYNFRIQGTNISLDFDFNCELVD